MFCLQSGAHPTHNSAVLSNIYLFTDTNSKQWHTNIVFRPTSKPLQVCNIVWHIKYVYPVSL